MESERKIEKMLRAYAKKRRGQAGDPLKLHPAMRRKLQGEVARRAARSEDEAGTVTLWELFRQRWAVLVGFAVVIFFGAALFLPPLSKAKFKAQKVAAMNHLKPIGLEADKTAIENNSNLPSSLDNQNGKPAGSQITTASGEFAANAPAAQAIAMNPLADQGQALAFTKAGAQNFATGRQNLFKNKAAAAGPASVLKYFQVLQSGNAIRVVDADGSVYDGSLQGLSMATQKMSVPSAQPAPAGSETGQRERPNGQPKTINARDELETVPNYSFLVSGMNRTLKQKVEFAGNLQAMAVMTTNLPPSSPAEAGLGVGGSGESPQAMPTSQLPWFNSRIAGSAIIGDTTNIEVNAVPQSP